MGHRWKKEVYRMKYKDSIEFEEKEFGRIIDKFIDKYKTEWEEFIENEFQEYLQQDIDWDLEYERQRDYEDELKEIEK